jgi:endonuclease III
LVKQAYNDAISEFKKEVPFHFGGSSADGGNMNEAAIAERLLQFGGETHEVHDESTGVPEADALVYNLSEFPHAFVLACLMDRGEKWQRAWQVPYEISLRLPDFSISTLSGLSLDQLTEFMSQPKKLHRYFQKMSEVFYEAVQRIRREYDGHAERIWIGKPSSAEVVYRFLEFKGAGPKIATMATNILARDCKIEFSDYYSVDISVDEHVRRVFERLGLRRPEGSDEEVIYKARALSPDYPGRLDLPCWVIGRRWCTADKSKRECGSCYMRDLCPSALA